MADLIYSRAELERALNKLVWTNWTPTVSSASGSGATFDVQIAEYFRLGDTIYFNLVIKITATGTASGAMTISLPFAPDENTGRFQPILGTGREGDATGIQHKLYWSSGLSLAALVVYNSVAFTWTTNHRHFISGSYKIA
jgi:hypothetical protein